jgi:hypothetical protein
MAGICERVTFHSAAAADANGTELDVAGMALVGVQITGTITTIAVYWEGTIDGTNWVGIPGTTLATGAKATSVTATGLYQIPVAGLSKFRARLDWTSGTSVTVTGLAVYGVVMPALAP